MICGESHPSGAHCQMPEGQHQWHTGIAPDSMPPQGVDWPNENYVAPVRARTKASREQHKAMLRAAVRGDAPQGFAAHWAETKQEWLREAKRVLHTYCQTHDEPFTTPQDIWPLLDSPGEMRAFTVVVQHALRRRWITEVGSVRLRDTYTTRDGKQFEMNKLVPVYRSRIVIDPEGRSQDR